MHSRIYRPPRFKPSVRQKVDDEDDDDDWNPLYQDYVITPPIEFEDYYTDEDDDDDADFFSSSAELISPAVIKTTYNEGFGILSNVLDYIRKSEGGRRDHKIPEPGYQEGSSGSGQRKKIQVRVQIEDYYEDYPDYDKGYDTQDLNEDYSAEIKFPGTVQQRFRPLNPSQSRTKVFRTKGPGGAKHKKRRRRPGPQGSRSKHRVRPTVQSHPLVERKRRPDYPKPSLNQGGHKLKLAEGPPKIKFPGLKHGPWNKRKKRPSSVKKTANGKPQNINYIVYDKKKSTLNATELTQLYTNIFPNVSSSALSKFDPGELTEIFSIFGEDQNTYVFLLGVIPATLSTLYILGHPPVQILLIG